MFGYAGSAPIGASGGQMVANPQAHNPGARLGSGERGAMSRLKRKYLGTSAVATAHSQIPCAARTLSESVEALAGNRNGTLRK